MLENKRMENFYSLKGIVIISVIIAHSNYYGNFSIIYNLLGAIGVPIFFFISGYLYSLEKANSFKGFILKKIKKLFPNWILGSLFVYLVSYIFGSRKGVENIFIDYLSFFLGYKSLYYFMTVLFLFYLVFFFIRIKVTKDILAISIILNILSTHFIKIFIYLNPLNFISFFCLGMYLSCNENIFEKIIKEKILFFVLSIFYILIKFNYGIMNDYFGILNLVGLNLLVMLFLNLKKNNILENIGKISFIIYSYHLSFMGLLNRKFAGYPLIKVVLIIILFSLIMNIFKSTFYDKKIKVA